MNIFILDDDPIIAARSQCDKHICKMVLESTQMLCLALPKSISPYKQAYQNHPCSKWALQSFENYQWLLTHAKALSDEYTFRYYKKHKCDAVIQLITNHLKYLNFQTKKLTPFAQAMPNQYKDDDPVKAYRAYYLGDKRRFAKWNHGRLPPLWWPY